MSRQTSTHFSQLLVRLNLRMACKKWGASLSTTNKRALRELSERLKLSVAADDLLLIDDKWYVTYSGLLRLASRRGCAGIDVAAVPQLCDPPSFRWAFKATVYKSRACRGFVGFGDADPTNVSSVVRGAEMRVAETRAVNRALRKAYGIGICSVEELGSLSAPTARASSSKKLPPRSAGGNGNGNGQPKLRDRLCLLIRQHRLDASLVKRFATDFCGVPDLRQASREQVEAFITHIGELATKDRDGLVSKLNSYAEKHEGAGAA